MSLRSFLHMPDEEYIAAFEEAMNENSNFPWTIISWPIAMYSVF